MRTILIARALTLLFPLSVAADPVLGVWQTGVEDGGYGHVQITPCGASLCGKIIRSYAEDGRAIQSAANGYLVLTGMSPLGGGAYEGRASRPGGNRTYIAKMALREPDLKMSGCVLGGVVCISQTWTRVD